MKNQFPKKSIVVSFEIELQTSRETPLSIGRFALVFSSFQIETTIAAGSIPHRLTVDIYIGTFLTKRTYPREKFSHTIDRGTGMLKEGKSAHTKQDTENKEPLYA